MTLCPRCQMPNPEGHGVCQTCGASLSGAGPETEAPLAARAAVRSRLLPLAGVAAGLAVLVWLAYSQGYLSFFAPPPPPSAPPAPPAGPSAPAAPAPSLPEQVQALFNTLREAQLKKDLTLFLSCYSPSFPGLAEKRQQTQKAWEDYTFTNMFYFLDEVTPQGPDQAKVRVTWELQAQPRGEGETLTATQVFQVELRREGGAWKIAGLREMPAL